MSKVLKVAAVVVGTIASIALIASGVGAPIGAGLLGVSWATIATGAGLLGAVANLFSKKAAPPSEARNRLFATLDPNAPRKIVFGTTAMATDVRYQSYTGADQEYLHWIVCVAAHEVESIDEIWFESEKAWSASGGVTSKYAGYLTITPRHVGTSANGIAIDSVWTSACTLTGCAYFHARFKLTGNSKKAESPFASAVPNRVTVRGRGAKLLDPRLSTALGGSGSQTTTQSTWTFGSGGNNPALQLLFYYLGWTINGKLSVGRGLPAARLDMASFIAAANMCDEAVVLAAGGTEPRYRSAGVFSEGDDPATVRQNLLNAMNAVLRDDGGRISLHVLHNDLSDPDALHFSEDDVLGDESWRQTPSIEQTFNIVRGRYTDASDTGLYQLAEAPEVELESFDGIDRIDTFDLACVQSASQWQRLAKQRLQRAQYAGVYSATFNARAWGTAVGRPVRLSHAGLGWSNKLFRVVGQGIRMDGRVPLVLQEEHASIYAWDQDEAPAVTSAVPTVYDPTLNPIVVAIVESGQGRFRGEWTPDTAYAVDDLFVHGGATYRVTIAHTADEGDEPPNDNVEVLPGSDGLSIIELSAFKRSSSAPSTPAGGSYNFTTKVLSPPSGWFTVPPDGTATLYAARGAAFVQGTGGTATPTWSGVGKIADDGSSVDVVFTRASTQPDTPGVSAGIPSGWYGDVSSVPASSHPLWSSFGQRAGGAAVWTWDVPKRLEASNGSNNAIVFMYRRSATQPAGPSGLVTYTFSTKALSGDPGGGWLFAPPAGSDPLYIIAATASSTGDTDTILSAEWSEAQILGANGLNGLNTASVFLYRRTTTNVAPALPSSSSTYTFATGALTGHNNGWSQSIPAVADGQYLWMTLATAIASTSTDSISSVEWASASLIAQNGLDGSNNAVVYMYQRSASAPAAPFIEVTYTFSTKSLSGTPGSGWLFAPPAGSDHLWVVAATASAKADTDVIAANEWSEPVQLGATGIAGLNNATVFLYQRSGSTTSPALPSSSATYTFATGVLTGHNNGWTQAVPDASGGKHLHVTTATAVSSAATDTIPASEWSAARVMASDGTDGAPGSSTSVIFIRSAAQPSTPSASSGVPAGWYSDVASVPASANPMWSSFGTRPNASSNWTWNAPVKVEGQDGGEGDPGPPGEHGGFGWAAIANGIVEGNTLRRAAPTNNYDAAAVGPAFQAGLFVQQKNLQDSSKWQMLALDNDATSYDYTQQTYMLQVLGQAYQLYVNGVLALNSSNSALLSSKNIRFETNRAVVRCFADNVEVFAYAHKLAAGVSLFPKVIAYGHTATITELNAGPIGAAAIIGENVVDSGGSPIVEIDVITRESPILERIGDDGRVYDPRFYNTQLLLGVTSTTNLAPYYTANGSNWTVTLPAHVRKVAGPSGAISLSYGAGSGVVAPQVRWMAYIVDVALTGNASPTIHFTTNADDLLQPGAYLVSSGYSPATGTADPPPPGGGGGGGGFENLFPEQV